ncbi:LysR family transcriptional regulator [Actibacterium mucosum KCTC 23349]|uniref:LysR family transcriptional regulator n=1 Tax=Actibacterium mucosum KCTC 23349 TaxID=1454373 RepID=A0A037ZE48_9RHOB|nr:LysR family transcriptional regulator [Actibacterium mucosum]KAJ54769.1 LysR family transcriptional regulator [Actibacterium mucosum KCTC 23349]
MELRRLRYFIALAEEKHFGRAATRLQIAQPPLSRAISALEDEVGAQLFDRSRSQIKLTQAGEVFEGHARHLVDRLDSAYRETRAVGQGSAGRLRLAFVGSASYGVLPTLIKSYRSHYPEVELALSAMNNAALHSALVQGEIDLAVARPSLQDDELRSQELSMEPLILAIPDNSPLAAKSALSFRDLADQTLVLYPRRPRPSYADQVLAICAREGFEPRATEMAQDYQTAISLVSVGAGIAVVPKSVSEATRPGVFFRSYKGHNPGTALSLHARIDNRTSHVMNFFDVARKFRRGPKD